MVQVLVKVRDLKAGDRFRGSDGGGWDAVEDAKPRGDGGTQVLVRYEPDGGMGGREWDDSEMELTVERMT